MTDFIDSPIDTTELKNDSNNRRYSRFVLCVRVRRVSLGENVSGGPRDRLRKFRFARAFA